MSEPVEQTVDPIETAVTSDELATSTEPVIEDASAQEAVVAEEPAEESAAAEESTEPAPAADEGSEDGEVIVTSAVY